MPGLPSLQITASLTPLILVDDVGERDAAYWPKPSHGVANRQQGIRDSAIDRAGIFNRRPIRADPCCHGRPKKRMSYQARLGTAAGDGSGGRRLIKRGARHG